MASRRPFCGVHDHGSARGLDRRPERSDPCYGPRAAVPDGASAVASLSSDSDSGRKVDPYGVRPHVMAKVPGDQGTSQSARDDPEVTGIQPACSLSKACVPPAKPEEAAVLASTNLQNQGKDTYPAGVSEQNHSPSSATSPARSKKSREHCTSDMKHQEEGYWSPTPPSPPGLAVLVTKTSLARPNLRPYEVLVTRRLPLVVYFKRCMRLLNENRHHSAADKLTGGVARPAGNVIQSYTTRFPFLVIRGTGGCIRTAVWLAQDVVQALGGCVVDSAADSNRAFLAQGQASQQAVDQRSVASVRVETYTVECQDTVWEMADEETQSNNEREYGGLLDVSLHDVVWRALLRPPVSPTVLGGWMTTTVPQGCRATPEGAILLARTSGSMRSFPCNILLLWSRGHRRCSGSTLESVGSGPHCACTSREGLERISA